MIQGLKVCKRKILQGDRIVGVITGLRYWNYVPGKGNVPDGGFGIVLNVDGVLRIYAACIYSYYEETKAEVTGLSESMGTLRALPELKGGRPYLPYNLKDFDTVALQA